MWAQPEKALAGALSVTMSVMNTSNPLGRGSNNAQPSHTRLQEEEEEYTSGRGSASAAESFARREYRQTAKASRLSGLINTIRLWNLVTPLFSYANMTLLFAASMTVCAQVLITWLPVFIGRATKELTGGSSGQFADLEKLSTELGLAFVCIFLYVSLRGGTQVLIMLMGLRWRYNLTRTLHSLYFSRKAYYRVNCMSGLDNVDSRLASDLSTFIKLCCGGVSPPLNSTYVGIVGDVFLIITATFACLHRAGSRITGFAYILQRSHTPCLPALAATLRTRMHASHRRVCVVQVHLQRDDDPLRHPDLAADCQDDREAGGQGGRLPPRPPTHESLRRAGRSTARRGARAP